MTLRYTRRALADLDRILTYTEQHSPRGASSLARGIEAVVQSIETHPRSGRRTSRRNVRMRVVGNYPYLIFYRITRNGDVSIVHVRHAARRPFAR